MATRELAGAQHLRDSVYKQNNLVSDFIRGTFRFINAKKDAPRHGILVQWVLDQVPLVEAELAQSEATNVNPDKPKRGSKRRRGLDNGLEERSLKQQKLDDGHVTRPAATAQAIPQGLRRSSRIAAREAKKKTATPLQPSRKGLRTRS